MGEKKHANKIPRKSRDDPASFYVFLRWFFAPNPINSKSLKSDKKWLLVTFGVPPKRLQSDPKMTFWPQKWFNSNFFVVKSHFWGHFWVMSRESLFSHFWVTLNLLGFGGCWGLPGSQPCRHVFSFATSLRRRGPSRCFRPKENLRKERRRWLWHSQALFYVGFSEHCATKRGQFGQVLGQCAPEMGFPLGCSYITRPFVCCYN